MTSTSTTILFWEKEGKFKRLLVCEKSPIQQKKNPTYIKYYGSHCWSIMEKPQRQKKHKSSRKIAYSCTMLVLSKYNVFSLLWQPKKWLLSNHSIQMHQAAICLYLLFLLYFHTHYIIVLQVGLGAKMGNNAASVNKPNLHKIYVHLFVHLHSAIDVGEAGCGSRNGCLKTTR